MDTEFTYFPVCPHCGHEEYAPSEIDFGLGWDGDAEVTCTRCGEDYFCSRSVSVTYTTKPIATPSEERKP